jgi:CRISPR/Cas system CMR-associated protein Cmr1 (group 7 of RAMP superfamily)
MMDNGFLQKADDESFCLTDVGIIASNIAEIHPLPLSKLVKDWNYFDSFSAKQIVGLFSCFTDIKIPSDMKVSNPNIPDLYLLDKLKQLQKMYEHFEKIECEIDARTGINYENALQFDIIEFSMRWCDCNTETECKYFIQSDIADKEISIGDFNKAMLKIVTISKEWANVCEKLGKISALHKLVSIEKMILKYVTTSQSLYV